jgi:hypothetical protein
MSRICTGRFISVGIKGLFSTRQSSTPSGCVVLVPGSVLLFVEPCYNRPRRTPSACKQPPLQFPRKRLSRHGFLVAFDLRERSVQDQHPPRHPLAHAHVQVRLRALDVVAQVAAEAREQRDGRVLAVAADVAFLRANEMKPAVSFFRATGRPASSPGGSLLKLTGGAVRTARWASTNYSGKRAPGLCAKSIW